MRAELDSHRALRRQAEHNRAMERLHRREGLHEEADAYAADAAADEDAVRRGYAPPRPPTVDPVDALLVAAHNAEQWLAVWVSGASDGVDVFSELGWARAKLAGAIEEVMRQREPRKSEAA
jgi:phosphoglucomutase